MANFLPKICERTYGGAKSPPSRQYPACAPLLSGAGDSLLPGLLRHGVGYGIGHALVQRRGEDVVSTELVVGH